MDEINLSPCQAIKLYCRTRCFTTAQEVKDCPDPDCPLFSRRLGKDPNRAKAGGNTRWTKERQPGKNITVYTARKKAVEFDVKGKERVRITIENVEEE